MLYVRIVCHMLKFRIISSLLLLSVVSLLHADYEPEEGAVLSRSQVYFDWDDEVDAMKYQIQIANNVPDEDGFEKPILSLETLTSETFIKEGIEFGTQYLWRVRSFSALGAGNWSTIREFSLRSIPINLPIDITVTVKGEHQPGITIFNNCNRAVGVDMQGNICLLVDFPNNVGDITLLDTGEILALGGGNVFLSSINDELIWTSPNSYDAHHAASIMPNGDVMFLAREYQDVEDEEGIFEWRGDRIVVLDIATNQEQWSWSTFDYYSTEDYDSFHQNHRNAWTHGNASYYHPPTNAVYFSSRSLSRITKIDWATKEIVWNMGTNLATQDCDFGENLFSYQHAPEIQPNGNIVLFDNGNRRDGVPADPKTAYSRAVEIKLNEDTVQPAEIVWEWTTRLYCPSTGDADRLPIGTTLVTAVHLDAIYEVDSTQNIVSQVDIKSKDSCGGLRPGYRAERVTNLKPNYVDPNRSDINGDNLINVSDLLAIISAWGTCEGCLEDVNLDSFIDVSDLLLVIGNWSS